VTDFTNQAAVEAAFLAIAAEKPHLSQMLSEPLVRAFSSTIAQMGMSFNYRVDRADQERYLMSAANRSTVLAKAEDRQYTPAKAIPSSGILAVTDINKAYGGIPSGIELLSDDSVLYYTDEAATFDVDGAAAIAVKQMEKIELSYTVDIKKPFFEVTIPAEHSPRIVKILVYVDMGSGLELWRYAKRLRNVNSGDKAYDEFYNSADEFGIRFGTDIVGIIPTNGAAIKLEIFLSDGETTLISGEDLKPTDGLQFSDIEFSVTSAIVGGSAQEDTESIRINSLYYEAFDEQYVWNDDYQFFLKRNMPLATWVNFWGEKHQELIAGAYNKDHINKIYISAYEPNNASIEADVIVLTGELPNLNREYIYVTPTEHTFTVTISGIAMRNQKLIDAKNTIHTWLIKTYGKDSRSRKGQPFKRDIYEGLRKLKVFDKEFEVDVSISGKVIADNLSQFIFLDEAATLAAITVSYT